MTFNLLLQFIFVYTYLVLISQENVWLDKLDKCLKKSVKTIATDAEEISEELDVNFKIIVLK